MAKKSKVVEPEIKFDKRRTLSRADAKYKKPKPRPRAVAVIPPTTGFFGTALLEQFYEYAADLMQQDTIACGNVAPTHPGKYRSRSQRARSLCLKMQRLLPAIRKVLRKQELDWRALCIPRNIALRESLCAKDEIQAKIELEDGQIALTQR